jgi:hypothetical protein
MTHLDTDVLAEFRAGLITGQRGGRIAAHLAGCERCTALDEQLAGVSVLLASVPAPALPDQVVQRLDTVLAAEVARKNDHPERAGRDAAVRSAAPGRPPRNRGFRLLALRLLAPAAAVVLLGAGVFGLTRLGWGSGTSSSASSAEGGAAQATSSAQATSGAEATPGAKSASGQVNGPAAAPQRMSPVSFSHAGFKQQVERALAVTPAAGTEGAASTQVRGCVRNLAGNAALIRVQSAYYEGQPATLVVIRTGSGREALIAGEKCSATTRDVLDSTSLP